MPDNNELWKKYQSHITNEGLTDKRKSKLHTMFKIIQRYIDLGNADKIIIEDFIERLNSDKILKIDGRIYSGSTKSDIKKFLRQFFKWFRGDNNYYPEMVSWLKTKIPKDNKPQEKPILEKKDVFKLASMFKKYDYKIATLILFDSGFRIQELMSCKKSDLTFESFDDNGEKCFWLKCNLSKTYTRKVPISLFEQEIKSYIESDTFNLKRDTEPLFDIDYFSYLKMMKIYSTKLFSLKVTPHCLRHSSATLYASLYNGNVPMLAQRYGWSYSAKELQTYVRVSGSYNKQGAKVLYQNEVIKLKTQVVNLTEELSEIKNYLKAYGLMQKVKT